MTADLICFLAVSFVAQRQVSLSYGVSLGSSVPFLFVRSFNFFQTESEKNERHVNALTSTAASPVASATHMSRTQPHVAGSFGPPRNHHGNTFNSSSPAASPKASSSHSGSMDETTAHDGCAFFEPI